MRRTEYLVIEAAVDTEGIIKIELPLELIGLLQRCFDERDGSELEGQARTFMFALREVCSLNNFTGLVRISIGVDDSLRFVCECGMLFVI